MLSHAEATIGVSCRDATGMRLATVAKPASRPRSRRAETVSASALALHLDCTRAYICKLEAEGVIQRHGDHFPLDQSRIAYIRTCGARGDSHRAVRQTPITSGSKPMLQLRLMEKKRELLRREDFDEAIDRARRRSEPLPSGSVPYQPRPGCPSS